MFFHRHKDNVTNRVVVVVSFHLENIAESGKFIAAYRGL